MLYDKYKNKIQKIAKAKNTIMFFKFVFLSIFVLIVLFSITLISSKGRLKKGIEMPSTINYGEDYDFNVKTYFNGGLKYFEYRMEGSSEWSKEKPSRVGTYYVRAVTNKFIGSRKSPEYQFKINKTNLDITVTSNTITYGSYPEYTSTGLIKNDKISEITFLFDSFANTKTTATISLDSVKVVDSNGIDVTDCYNLSANGKEIDFSKKQIEITPTMDSEIVYSGEEVKYQNTYTINTKLGYSDIAIVEGKIYDSLGNETNAILPGEYTVKINKYEIKNETDTTTQNYSVESNEFNFNIIKRSIVVETGEASKQYDGEALSNNQYSLSKNSPYNLVGEDTLKDETTIYPSITYYVENGIDNALNIRIYDKDNNDVTDALYNVSYRYGKLSIIKRDIVIRTTTDDSFIYTKTDTYSRATLADIYIDSGSLVDGDEIKLTEGAIQPSISEPGTVLNKIDFYIANTTDVTTSYNIIENYGSLIMKCKDITIRPKKMSVTYGEIENTDTSKCFELVGEYPGFESDVIDSTTVTVGYFKDNEPFSPRDVGTYEIRIIDFQTSSDFKIIVKENDYETLEITKRSASVTLNGFASPHTYDGNRVEYNYGDEATSNLVYGDKIQIEVTYHKSNGALLDEAPSNVGDYYVKFNSSNIDNNYDITSEKAYFSISERFVKLVPNRIDPIPYSGSVYDGYKNETFTILGDGLVLGDEITATYKIVNDLVPMHAGTYYVCISNIKFNNDNGNNYDVDYNSETTELTINPIELTVEFDISKTEKVYDGNPFEYIDGPNNFILRSGEILNGDTITLNYNFYRINTSDFVSAGKYILRKEGHTVNSSNSNDSDYVVNCSDKQLEIIKRFVEIKPFDMTIDYGQSITYDRGIDSSSSSYDFLPSDKSKFSIDVSYVGLDYSHPNVGSYKIVIDGWSATPGVNTSNYDIKFAGDNNYATLTINKKQISINLSNINSINSKTYDGEKAEYLSGIWNYDGTRNLPYGEELEVFVIYQKLDTSTGEYNLVNEMKDAGTYRVIFNDYYVTNDYKNNYDITCGNPLSFTINKKAISLKLKAQSMTYGDNYAYPTTNQYDVIDNKGFVGLDNITITVRIMNGSVDYTNNTNLLHVGNDYNIIMNNYSFTNGNPNNYSIDIEGSKLTVNKRNIYITYISREYPYDGDNHPFDYDNDCLVTNLVNGAKLSFSVKYNDSDEVPCYAGEYSVTLDRNSWNIINGYKSDYEVIENTPGSIIINPKEVRLGLVSKGIIYGNDNLVYEYDVLDTEFGFVAGDSITILDAGVYYKNGTKVTEISKLHVGEYDIKVISYSFNGSSIDNYIIKPIANATLTISKRPITIRLKNEIAYEYTYGNNGNIDCPYTGGYILISDSDELMPWDNLTVNVKYNDGNTVRDTVPRNAGTYVVSFASCNNNEVYSDYDVTCTNTELTSPVIVINKLEVELSLVNKGNNTYGENDGKPIYSKDIAITHSLTSNIFDIDKYDVIIEFIYKDANNNSYSEIKNVGKYYIYVNKFTDKTGNYIFNGISEDYYYEIIKREITIMPKDILDRDYNGKAIDYTNICRVISGSMASGESFTIEVEFKDSNNFVLEQPPKDAGTYTVHVKEVNDTTTAKVSNYDISYDFDTFTIRKKNVVIKPKTMENRVYRNQAYSYYTGNNNFDIYSGEFYDNDENKFSLDVMFSIDGMNPIDPINAGKYYVLPIGVNGSDTNYNVTYNPNSYTTFTIDKYSLVVSFKDTLLPKATKVYDGEEYQYDCSSYGNCTYTSPTFETINVLIEPYATDEYGNYYYFDNINNDSIKNYGNYILHLDSIKVENSDNYKLAITSQYEFKITKKEVHISINEVEESYNYIENNVLTTYANGFTTDPYYSVVEGETLSIIYKFKSQKKNGFYSPFDVDAYNIYLDYYLIDGSSSNNYNVIATNDGLVEFEITPKRLDIYASSSIYEWESLRAIYDKNNDYSDSNVLLYCDGLVNQRSTYYSTYIEKVTYYSYDGTELINKNPRDMGKYYVIASTIVINRSVEIEPGIYAIINVTGNYDIHNEYDSHKTLLEIRSEEITVSLKDIVKEIYYGDAIPTELSLNNSNATAIAHDSGIDYINQTHYKFKVLFRFEQNGEVVDINHVRDVGYYDMIIDSVEVKYYDELKDGDMFNLVLASGTKLHIQKKPITIKALTGSASDEMYYDGTPFPYVNGAKEIYFENKKYTLPYGETLKLDTITQDSIHQQIEPSSIIDAGTYYVVVDTSLDSMEWSYKSSNYFVTYDFSTITIKKALVTAVRSDNPYSEDTYDGMNIDTNDIINQFVIYVNGSEYNGSDVEGLKLEVSYSPFDSTKYAYLKYNNRHLEDANICDAGNYLFKAYDFIGDHNNYEFAVTLEVEFIINQIEISITTGTMSWTYDGFEHSYIEGISDVEGLLENHRVAPIDDEEDSITKVKDYTPEPVDNVIVPYIYDINMIYDEHQGDVTYNYKITISNGKLSITKRDLTITFDGDIEYTYNGLPQFEINNNCYEVDGLADGEIIILRLKESVKDADYYTNCEVLVKIDGKDPNNYNVIPVLANVMVYKASVEVILIQPKDYYFNNRAYTFNLTNCSGNPFLPYQSDVKSIEIEFTDEFGNPVENNFVNADTYNLIVSNFKVKNGSGVDRTSNFNIVVTYDNDNYFALEIKKPIIRIETSSATKLYDGTPLMNTNYSVYGNDKNKGIDEEHGYYDLSVLKKYGLTLDLDENMPQPSITHPNEEPNPRENELIFKVTDSNNSNLFDNFKIDYVIKGSLLITNEINISSYSFEYRGENVFELNDITKAEECINNPDHLNVENVRFELYDYVVVYSETYSDNDADYVICNSFEELGSYRILLRKNCFRIMKNDEDITDSIYEVGGNILNGGQTHEFIDGEECYYVEFRINKITLAIMPKSQTLMKTYDGTSLKIEGNFYKLVYGEVLTEKGHILEVGGDNELAGNAGSVISHFDGDKIRVYVKTSSGAEIDVTDYYDIKCTYNDVRTYDTEKIKEYMFNVALVIQQKRVNVVMPSEEALYHDGIKLYTVYDGNLEYNETLHDYIYCLKDETYGYNIYLRDVTELLDGHFIQITNINNSFSINQCLTAPIPNRLSSYNYKIYDEFGNDVTKNYIVNSVGGTLFINPSIIIKFESESAEKVKDGTPLACHEFKSISVYDAYNDISYTWDEFITIEKYKKFAYVDSNWMSITKVGSAPNTFNIDIYDDNNKITSLLQIQYGIKIEKEPGELVIKRNIG